MTAPRTFELSDANGVSADTISRANYGGDFVSVYHLLSRMRHGTPVVEMGLFSREKPRIGIGELARQARIPELRATQAAPVDRADNMLITSGEVLFGGSHDSTDILDGNINPFVFLLFLRHQHLALDETDAFDAVLLRLERNEPAGPPSDEFSQLLRLAVSQKNLRDSEDIAAWAAASAAVAAETGWAD